MYLAGAKVLSGIYISSNSGPPVLITNVQCNGREDSVLECQWSPSDFNGCMQLEAAGLSCEGIVIMC